MWDLYAREFIGTKVDIWALGCLFYLLCFGRLPFEGEAKLQILNGRYEIPPGTPASIRELLEGMLTINVARRWDIGQVRADIGGQVLCECKIMAGAAVTGETAQLKTVPLATHAHQISVKRCKSASQRYRGRRLSSLALWSNTHLLPLVPPIPDPAAELPPCGPLRHRLLSPNSSKLRSSVTQAYQEGRLQHKLQLLRPLLQALQQCRQQQPLPHLLQAFHQPTLGLSIAANPATGRQALRKSSLCACHLRPMPSLPIGLPLGVRHSCQSTP